MDQKQLEQEQIALIRATTASLMKKLKTAFDAGPSDDPVPLTSSEAALAYRLLSETLGIRA